jgi:hypothetical protein
MMRCMLSVTELERPIGTYLGIATTESSDRDAESTTRFVANQSSARPAGGVRSVAEAVASRRLCR